MNLKRSLIIFSLEKKKKKSKKEEKKIFNELFLRIYFESYLMRNKLLLFIITEFKSY